MLSLISSRVLSQRISLAGKYFRIALFAALCLVLLAPQLPAQSQNFDSNGFAGRVIYVAKHRFEIEITAVPANTIMVSAIVTGGGVTSNWGKYFGSKTVPITVNVGATIGGRGLADIANEYIKPDTSYTVKLEAKSFLGQGPARASASLTVRTKGHGPGLPYTEISNVMVTDHSISLHIVPFPGATFYRISRFSGDVDNRQFYNCQTTRTVTRHVPDKKDGTTRVTDVYYNPPPANRNGQIFTNNTRSTRPGATHGGSTHSNPYYARYCNLPADTTFYILVEAWRTRADNSAVLIAARKHEISTLPIPSPQLLGSDSQDNELNPTALPPIYIEVDYPGDPLTDVSLSWEAVSGASGYSLEVIGGNNESYAFPLGAGATSQRVNGLTPGADYTAYLTAYLQDGGKRTGSAHFGMADPPPTNTPVPPPPPTATPIPPTPVPPTPVPATPAPQEGQPDQQQDQQPDQMQQPDQQQQLPQPSGPYASLIADILVYRAEQGETSDHYIRWTRALAALWDAVSHNNPMTLSEAQGYLGRGWTRWQPVVAALTALQPPPPTNTAVPPPPPTNTPIPPPPPTNTPVPPPPPTNTPVPPPPPTNTPVPPPPEPEPEKEESYKVSQSLIDDIKDWRSEQPSTSDHAIRWTRVLAAFGKADHSDPMTSSEAKIYRDEKGWSRWIDVVTALENLGK